MIVTVGRTVSGYFMTRRKLRSLCIFVFIFRVLFTLEIFTQLCNIQFNPNYDSYITMIIYTLYYFK